MSPLEGKNADFFWVFAWGRRGRGWGPGLVAWKARGGRRGAGQSLSRPNWPPGGQVMAILHLQWLGLGWGAGGCCTWAWCKGSGRAKRGQPSQPRPPQHAHRLGCMLQGLG